ncbi:MAG: hypothetical protein R3C03_16780 [Pirellulaceae bacterium]
MIRFLLLAFLLFGIGLNQESEWSADDDTFDPTLQSVVIGDRSWIGDPSPFVHAGSKRTGYTYVNTTNYEGMPPSVQLSLMIPLEAGETQPSGGGMLMTDADQTKTFIEAIRKAINAKAEDKSEPVEIQTTMKGTNWTLRFQQVDDNRTLELVDKQQDAEHVYQFSINAAKKTIGALEHSLKKLVEQPGK